MNYEKIEFLSAILLVSKDPERLAKFYREVVGVLLENVKHGDTEMHYGCQLGDLHFAIHPIDNFKGRDCATGSVKLAFTIFDINAFVARVEQTGIKFAYPIKDTGFALMTALIDPDGNEIELTQLSDGWFKFLESRQQNGINIISRWKESKLAQLN
jgi:predicted enzyme related to lactoylglutathione lyase